MHLTFDWNTTLRRVRQRTAFVPAGSGGASCRGEWKRFPYGDRVYRFGGDALAGNWARLHRGDCEPYPDAGGLAGLLDANPALVTQVGDPAATAGLLQSAWRAYHAGDFAEAADQGQAAGVVGTVVAVRAALVHATYLEESEIRRAAILREAVEACGALVELAPNWANAWFVNGLALGRYCQHVPLVRTLAQGLGGKARDSLNRAVRLEPAHADAHVGLGIYGADVIDKVGAMVAALTYGVRREHVLAHFEAARTLHPQSPMVCVEYARALLRIGGGGDAARAHGLYADALACSPADAQERLDVEWARAELA